MVTQKHMKRILITSLLKKNQPLVVLNLMCSWQHIELKNPTQQKITDAFPVAGTIMQDQFDKRIIKFITNTLSAVNIIENQ